MRTWLLILFISYSLYSSIGKAAKQASSAGSVNHYTDPYTLIQEGQALLKEGDLVVRLNQDPTSQFIKNFNRRDKRYSHAGLVLLENGYPFIYHIVNGEENPGEKLRKDSLSGFCNPRKNLAYGIFRYKISGSEISRLKKLLHTWYLKQVQFDPAFDPTTNEKMYCSELISKALAKATDKRITIESTPLSVEEALLFSGYTKLPFAYTHRLQIVSIDNLYMNPFCYLIKEYNYVSHFINQ